MPEKKEKILVVRDNGSMRETKWSFRRLLTETWRRKWWVLGATALMAIAGTLSVQFIYNRSKINYSTTFGLELPYRSVSDNGTRGPIYGLYDNSRFAVTDFYSESTIQKVIASSPSFSSINAERLASHASLSVAGNVVEGVFVATVPYTLTLTFQAADFKSAAQASAFVTALIDYPISLALNALKSHEEVTPFYGNYADLDFARQIEVLTEKKKSISDAYDFMLASERNAASIKLEDGTLTLKQAEERFRFSHIIDGVEDISLYAGQLEANHFLAFENTAEGIAEKTSYLEAIGTSEIENVKTSIVALRSATEAYKRLAETTNIVTTESNYTAELVRLNKTIEAENASLNASLVRLKRIGYASGESSVDILNIKTIEQAEKITKLDSSSPSKDWGYLQHLANPTANDWATKCVAFGKTLASAKNVYSTDIGELNGHFNYLSELRARPYVQTPSVVKASGGINVFLGMAAGLVFGLLLSSVVATFVGIWKEDKNEGEVAKE